MSSTSKTRDVVAAVSSVALLVAVSALWIEWFLGFVDINARNNVGLCYELAACFKAFAIICASMIIGGVMRWLLGLLNSVWVLLGVTLLGAFSAGYISIASTELREALDFLPKAGGIWSLALFGTWLITFAYLMKLPWDRSTELIRDSFVTFIFKRQVRARLTRDLKTDAVDPDLGKMKRQIVNAELACRNS